MASRRRIKRIMNQKGLVSAYTRKKYKPRAAKTSEAEAPSVLNREFDGQLRRELNSYARWYNEEGMRPTLGCMSPVEFRNVGLSL